MMRREQEVAHFAAKALFLVDVSSVESAATPRLERSLGLWSAVAVVVGSTIGSGIFRTPASIAEKLGEPVAMLSVWVVAGLFVLCGALTMAELGSAFPYAGGIYVYLREAYGRAVAFLFGWAQLWIIRPSANGAVALVFAEYALRLCGWGRGEAGYDRMVALVAAMAVVIVGAANYRGVRWGAGLQNLTTLAKTCGLLTLVVCAFVLPGQPVSGTASPSAAAPSGFDVSAFGLALVGVLWAYDGWSDVSYVAGEVAHPKRNVPRAILMGTGIIIAVYLLANLAYLAVFRVAEIAAAEEVAADAMSRLLGGAGLTFIVATVMISTFGTLNGSLLTAPRIYFAMAEDRMLFRPIAKVHPRFHTPHVATLATMALAIAFIVIAKLQTGRDAFTTLTDAFVIALVPFYALAVAAVFVFRRRQAVANESIESARLDEELPPDAPEPPELAEAPNRPAYLPSVRTPIFPLVPAVFILSTFILLANALAAESSRVPTLITLGGVLLGVPVYALVFWRR